MADKPQNYANHTRWQPVWHFFAFPMLGINVLWSLVGLRNGPTLEVLFDIAVALALLVVVGLVRVSPLTVQDRLIRLEERLRMERLLPDDLKARLDELTLQQFIALRFASDGELEALTRKALDEKAEPKAIKQAIQNWRADYQRV
ncbi:MAG: DUF6526 family protein [Acidobacteria bacterium]|nr:DUF6526 family protein [Acidobacteriota bacterium]